MTSVMSINDDSHVASSEAAGTQISSQLSFPAKLMEILDKDLAPEAVWWLPGDKTFAVHSKKFATDVLDKYFQRTKFMSFVRKLNQWGFRRIPGQDVPSGVVAYVHASFRKGCPELLEKICDRKKAKNKTKQAQQKQQQSAAPSPPAHSRTISLEHSSPVSVGKQMTTMIPISREDSPVQSASLEAFMAAARPPAARQHPDLATSLERLQESVRLSQSSTAAAPAASGLTSLQALQAFQQQQQGTASPTGGSNDLNALLESQIAQRVLLRNLQQQQFQQLQHEQEAARSSSMMADLLGGSSSNSAFRLPSPQPSSFSAYSTASTGNSNLEQMASSFLAQRAGAPSAAAAPQSSDTVGRLLMLLQGQRGGQF